MLSKPPYPSKIENIICGKIIHSLQNGDIEVCEGGIAVSSNGIISSVIKTPQELKNIGELYDIEKEQVIDLAPCFLIPGFVDTHCHAPQYLFTGTGTGIDLLQWLEKFTFNYESKYSDYEFARDVYTKAVRRSLRYGITTACYYATIHLETSKLLAHLCSQFGQRAFVGKVCMDRNSPPYYIEDTQQSIRDTEVFIQYVLDSLKDPIVKPIITPRFVPSCSPQLMTALGDLGKKYKEVPIQSHISENKSEVAWVKTLHPNFDSYSRVYEHYNLLNHKAIMAHAIYLSDDEIRLFKQCDVLYPT
jgi:guanine deaminase